MKRMILVALSAVLLGIIAGSVVGGLKNQAQARPGEVRVTVIVEHYRDGKLINRVVDEKDPFTQNYVDMLKSGGSPSNSLIYIGDGNVAFSISDTAMKGVNVLSRAPSAPQESIIDLKVNYTLSASFSLSSAMTIYEVGYATNNKLLLRDLLPSPISAVAGDTVTVTYIIRVNG